VQMRRALNANGRSGSGATKNIALEATAKTGWGHLGGSSSETGTARAVVQAVLRPSEVHEARPSTSNDD